MTGTLSAGGLGLLFDALVAVLLAIMIVYAAILNRKLTLLRESKQEMEALLGRFAGTVKEAETGLAALRESANAAGEALQGRIDRGKGLADDLVFLVERGGALADRLEGGARSGARAAPSGRQPEPEEVRRPPADPEQEALIEQLRGVR